MKTNILNKIGFQEWAINYDFADSQEAQKNWNEWYGENCKYIYLSDDEECPYCGLALDDGTFAVVGCRRDEYGLTYEEMHKIVTQELQEDNTLPVKPVDGAKPMKLTVNYVPYDRYAMTGNVKGTVIAPTMRQALLAILDRIGMYCKSEDVRIQEQEQGFWFSEAEIIKRYIEKDNGDGCDFVMRITDETEGSSIDGTGAVLFTAEEIPEEQDWVIVVK